MTGLKRLSELLINNTTIWDRTRLSTDFKSDGSPVSNVDLSLDAFITNFLLKNYPGIWVVSEEEPESQRIPSLNLVAQLDPLDGTENYISGLPIWGVSISIWRMGKHSESLLVFPELGISLKSGDATNSFNSRIYGHPSSAPLDSLKTNNSQTENRILGSSAFNLYCVATGRFASFCNDFGAHSWDIIAGLSIALEQGCEVEVEGERYYGHFLEPNRKYRFRVRAKTDNSNGQRI